MSASPSSTPIELDAVALPATTAAPLITVLDAPGSPGAPALTSPTPSAQKRSTSSRRWYAPHRVWHVYLLILLSFGLYAVVWSYRFAHDFRRHRKRRARPWLHLVAWAASLGLAAPYVVYRHARWIRRLNQEIEHQTWPEPEVIAGLCAATIGGGLAVIIATQTGYLDRPVGLLVGLAVYATLPLPWAVLQRQLNVFKDTRPAGPWADPPYKLRRSHYAVMAIGAALMVLIGDAVRREYAPRSLGDALAANVPVVGTSGYYSLVPREAFWVRVQPGTLTDGADLELIGPTLDTQAVVTVFPGSNWSVDEITGQRLAAIRPSPTPIERTEERTLIPGTLYVRSDARYVVSRDSGRVVYQVVTILTPDRAFELVAFTPETGGDLAEIEAIVRSFSLL